MSEAIDPEQPMFLRVPVKCLEIVLSALRSAGFEKEAAAVSSFTRDYVDPGANANRLKWVARADAEARDGEVEFDSDATISHSEGGQYVLGWVWVDGPGDLDEGVCRECGEPCFVTPDGVSHHGIDHDAGGIDYDADADHVAILMGEDE